MQRTFPNKSPQIITWMVVLTVSILPKVVLQEVFKYPVNADLQLLISLVIILGTLSISVFWKQIASIRPFLWLILVLVLAEWVIYNRIDLLPMYRTALNHPSFNVYMLAEQSLRLLVTAIIIGWLFLTKKNRRSFFLTCGDTQAPAQPIRWLGIPQGTPWNRLGWILAGCISLGTLTFLVIAGRPSADILIRVLPFIPAVILAAALNAFNEEMTYKASFLAVLENPIGSRQALLMMAAYFGIGHYYGVPYGIIGVLMAGFLGWILGKSMLDTRGMFWAWLIHFFQDVLIFTFLAIGFVTSGGK